MLIKNALLVDAAGEMLGDLCIEEGKIASIGKELFGSGPIIDAKGRTVMPAFVDLHSHFRTPGYEEKEDIFTGSRAAARGGYTFVNCMPNTNPICSNEAIARETMAKAREINICDINQTVSITQDFDGKTLSHLEKLPDDLRFISDDGRGVQSSSTMYNAMKIAERRGLLIMSHAEDMKISHMDYRAAEDLETIRNIYLCAITNARLHMCHVSTRASMEAICEAKLRGVPITCEVTPHHIYFSDNDYKVNPPIRTKTDVDYLIQKIKEGKVDAIATDHAPHTKEDKEKGAAGMVGLETAFGVCYTVLCQNNRLPLSDLSRMMSHNPAKIMGLNKGLLRPGYDGDLVIVDTSARYMVHSNDFTSKSHNTAFEGEELTGRVELTVKNGEITYVVQR